eukprot:gene31408-39496_t
MERTDDLTPEDAWDAKVAWVIRYVKQCPCPHTYTYLEKNLTKIKRRRNTLQGNDSIARLVKKDHDAGHTKPLTQVAFESDVAMGVPNILKRLRTSSTSPEGRIGDVDAKWLPYLKKPWSEILTQSAKTIDEEIGNEDAGESGEVTAVDLREMLEACARVIQSKAYSRTARIDRVVTPWNRRGSTTTTPCQSINAAIETCGYKLRVGTKRKRQQCNKHKTDRREVCSADIYDQIPSDVLAIMHITCDACTRKWREVNGGGWWDVTYPYCEHASHHVDIHLEPLERELRNEATGYVDQDIHEAVSVEGPGTESVDTKALREWIRRAQLKLRTTTGEQKSLLEFELKHVTTLVEAAEDGGGRHSVHYHRSRKVCFGRRYGTGACIQRLRKAVRTIAARKYYHDIDIENCNPHIAWQMAKKDIGATLSCLERYCKDRDAVLRGTMQFYNVNWAVAKRLYIVLMFGGTIDTWKRECDRHSRLPGDADGEFPDAQLFANEMKALDAWVLMRAPILTDAIRNWNERVKRTKQGKCINDAGRLAFAIQIEEDKIIAAIEAWCHASGWKT